MDKARKLFIIVALLGAAGAGSACNRTPAEEQRQAMEAQNEANRDIHEANREATERSAEIRQDTNERAAELRKDYDKTVAEGNEKIQEAQKGAREESAEAQAKANETIREANRGIVASDDTLREWGQERIDSLNTKIDEARVKAEKAEPKVRAEFEAGMKDVQAKRDAIVTEFAAVDTKSEQAVEKFKSRADNELDRLEDRVEKLEGRL